MHIGEKIEAILYTRTSGELGEYIGESAKTFGACSIEGKIYKVERYIETDNKKPFWTVRNVTDGTTATADDEYYLPCIRSTDFH